MNKSAHNSKKNVSRGIFVLFGALALTVFMSSLIIENRSTSALYRAISNDGLNAIAFDIENAVADGNLSEAEARAAALLAEGHKFLQANNRGGALELYQAALKLTPGNPEIVRALGYVQFDQKRYASAATYIEQYVKFEPDCEPLWFGRLGIAQMQTGKYPEALASLTRVMNHDPDDGAIHFAMACVYSKMNDLDHAFMSLEKAKQQLGSDLLAYIHDPHLDNVRRSPRFKDFLRADLNMLSSSQLPRPLNTTTEGQ